MKADTQKVTDLANITGLPARSPILLLLPHSCRGEELSTSDFRLF